MYEKSLTKATSDPKLCDVSDQRSRSISANHRPHLILGQWLWCEASARGWRPRHCLQRCHFWFTRAHWHTHTHTYKCKRTSTYAHHLIGLCEHKAHVQMLTLLHTPFQYFGICISLRCFIYRRPYAHTLPHKHALSIICRTFFACGKMTLLSFIFTSLPLRLARERGRRGEGEGEREREREEKKKVPKTANPLQRRVIDSGMGN